jgi:hypothetical protein
MRALARVGIDPRSIAHNIAGVRTNATNPLKVKLRMSRKTGTNTPAIMRMSRGL